MMLHRRIHLRKSIKKREKKYILYNADALTALREMPDESVHCCVTSPPYWNLRDYGIAGQLGLEKSPDEYVARMVEVFREVRRVLRNDGTLFLNLGDSYFGSSMTGGTNSKEGSAKRVGRMFLRKTSAHMCGSDDKTPQDCEDRGCVSENPLKPKDLCGIPWRVAFALQADGWYLRSDIIWHKPNPMPESVTDRPTKAHEYLFLMSKSAKYYYDAEAVKESVADCGKRNKRSVWTVATKPFKGAHFATFPPKLIEPCIIAGCPEKVCSVCGAPWERLIEKEYKGAAGVDYKDTGASRGRRSHTGGGEWAKWKQEHPDIDHGLQPSCVCNADTTAGIVLDPFGGSGTTGLVALQFNRRAVLIELRLDYCAMIHKRLEGVK